MIKKSFKLFFKMPRILIPAILLIIFQATALIYYLKSYSINGDVFLYILNSFSNCLISFIIIFYVSYEFFYLLKRSKIDEAIYANRNGKIKTLSSMAVVLTTIPALEFLIMFLFELGVILNSGMTDYSYIVHIASVLFLYIFLVGLIPIFIGAIFALKFKRIGSYSLAALIFFILSDISDILFMVSQKIEINLWVIKYFFGYILPNDLNSMLFQLDTYGIPGEIYRWNLVLFWIFLLLFFYILICKIKIKKVRVVSLSLAGVLAVINLVGYFKGGSHYEFGPQLDSISMESYYYNKYNKPKTMDADFSVEKYDMKLNIWRQLDAEINMKLSDESLNSYNFTLFHGYRVERVTDSDGMELPFDREGDYLTVHSNKNTPSLNIKYSGYSPILYSSSQGCVLPGFFPYYPIPGFYDFIKSQSYTPILDLKKAEFKIDISSPRQFYSNLNSEEQNKNCFIGKTDYPTLISGFFRDDPDDDYKIIAQTVKGWGIDELDAKYIDEIKKIIEEKSKDEDIKIDLNNITIIQVPYYIINGFYTSGLVYFISDDQLFITFNEEPIKDEEAEHIIRAKKLGYKKYLYDEWLEAYGVEYPNLS